MVRVSCGEESFVVSGGLAGVREDGRSVEEVRGVELRVNEMPHAAGSARVRFGDADVIVGVQLQLESASPTTDTTAPAFGTTGSGSDSKPVLHPPSAPTRAISFSVECAGSISSSSSSRAVSSSSSSTTTADVYAMQRRLSELYSALPDCVEFEQLEIVKGRTWWRLNVHVLLLQSARTSVTTASFDAITLAVRAALRTTIVPRVRVLPSDGDRPPEVLLLDDDRLPSDAFGDDDGDGDAQGAGGDGADTLRGGWRVEAGNAPLTASVCVMGGGKVMVADPSESEQACADALVTVAVDKHGDVCGMYYEACRAPVAIKSAAASANYSIKSASENLRSAVQLALTSARALIATTDAQIDADLAQSSSLSFSS